VLAAATDRSRERSSIRRNHITLEYRTHRPHGHRHIIAHLGQKRMAELTAPVAANRTRNRCVIVNALSPDNQNVTKSAQCCRISGRLFIADEHKRYSNSNARKQGT